MEGKMSKKWEKVGPLKVFRWASEPRSTWPLAGLNLVLLSVLALAFAAALSGCTIRNDRTIRGRVIEVFRPQGCDHTYLFLATAPGLKAMVAFDGHDADGISVGDEVVVRERESNPLIGCATYDSSAEVVK